ncbi:MAG TPA: ribosome biogenesis GTPase YlqF [Bacillota bacterium]|nr:ribosome biogenesis GTPase YlqF [Bacillota bacterium]
MSYSWYPGHMAKAVREIRPLLKLIDVVMEIVDARAPLSSSNPMLKEIAAGKPTILILNKADLADQDATNKWIRHFRDEGRNPFATNAESGEGIARALGAFASMDIKSRTKARAIIVGMPNVGKSSLINRLAKKASARTGDKPGITRGRQWIDIGAAELLDTPGLMPLRVEDPDVWSKLCALGIISDDLFDREKVAKQLLKEISDHYPGALSAKYGFEGLGANDGETSALEKIAHKKGCLSKGGAVDLDKAAFLLIKDFRSGRIGRISLERS